MNIVIIEDSRLARQELRALVANHPAHHVVGEADTMQSGINLVEAEHPDLALLDIQLPDGDGFSRLERLSFVPNVVFTTAYDEYAVQAFKVSALDYLLKPITAGNLSAALAKAEAKLCAPSARSSSTPPKSRRDHIFFRDGSRHHFVRLRDISLFEVDGNYTRSYFLGGHAMMPNSLSYLDQRLDGGVFFRVSRRHIVNLDYIETVESWINDGLHIRLSNGREIEVSRRQAAALRQRLSI